MESHLHLGTSPSRAVNLLQSLIGDFYECRHTVDTFVDDNTDRILADTRFIANNRALPASIAASLHALLLGARKGSMPSHDLLLCLVSVMAALTGGGALDRFLRTRRGGVDVIPAHKLLHDAVAQEFRRVFGSRDDLLYGSFKLLLTSANIVELLANSRVESAAGMRKLNEDQFKEAVKKMEDENYFLNSAWTDAVLGSLMQAEQMSWELIGGVGQQPGNNNGPLQPLVVFEVNDEAASRAINDQRDAEISETVSETRVHVETRVYAETITQLRCLFAGPWAADEVHILHGREKAERVGGGRNKCRSSCTSTPTTTNSQSSAKEKGTRAS